MLVKYGPEFFEFRECQCRTCEVKRREDTFFDIMFDLILEDVCLEVATVSLTELSDEISPPCSSSISRPRQFRLRGRELIEEIMSYEQQAEPSFADGVSVPLCPNTNMISSLSSDSTFTSEDAVSDTSSYLSSTVLGSAESRASLGDENSNVSSIGSLDETVPPNNRISSPLRPTNLPDINPPASTITASERFVDASTQDESDNIKLFNGSHVALKDALLPTELFCSRFSLSDEASTALYSLVKSLLPPINEFPSGYSYVKNVKQSFSDNLRSFEITKSESLCVFKFRFQLRDIVMRNLNQIFNYSEHRKNNPEMDLNNEIAPRVQVRPNHTTTINLNMFTDGVSIKKSTFKREVWPIWLQITDLPPVLRMARKNIVLAAPFVGSGIPDWQNITPQIRAELLSPIEVQLNYEISLSVGFQVNLLVADLGAKSHLLNMFKFNGFFGCHYFTVKGITIGRTHSYYPFSERGMTREPILNDIFTDFAESLSAEEVNNVVGVKGRSAFAGLIKNLPLTAPTDYMHCVLLGVVPETLKLCHKTLTNLQKNNLKEIVENLNCPREIIAYSRKIRSLDEVGQFKANEIFNWLFYIAPMVFRELVPHPLFKHLMNLVFGIRSNPAQVVLFCRPRRCSEIFVLKLSPFMVEIRKSKQLTYTV